MSHSIAAQETAAPTISTDRPSVGTGPGLVPVYRGVIENGIGWTRQGGIDTFDGFESLVRFGVSNHLEMRFSPPNLEKRSDTAQMLRQDSSVGAKIALPSSTNWPVSAVLTLTIPSGSAGVTSGGWDPEALLCVAHTWNPRLSNVVSGNMAWVSGGWTGREQATQLAFDQYINLTAKVTSFVEYAPLLSRDPQLAGQTADAGLTWVIGRRYQLDARGGMFANSTGRSPVVGVGYSVLFR